MIRLIFTEEMRERLRQERIHHSHPRVRQRLEALYLKSEGWPHQAICASLGISGTLVSYLRLFQDGVTALTGCRFRRAQSALAPYEAVIVAAFTHQPPATLVEASSRIAELTGVHRSPNQVGLILTRVATAQARAIPGPAPTEARRVEQQHLRNPGTDPTAERSPSVNGQSFFRCRSLCAWVILSWVWCRRCWQPTPQWRQRLSVLGALNAVTHELITVTTDAYINSQHVCRMLYRQRHRTDRAHHGRFGQRALPTLPISGRTPRST
ncbi:MAG: hypothetical protein R3F36_10955 [Candidatus Competibacteraceae bacterium]